ncbi:pantoate--beta-alanine ligase [Pontibacillus litoralis]|uniref:Pantothenate synthetase n=1 Tax=Pontibacillus litoralis JSM 072002 TaxID=1385512 RepID=A0A0A5G4A0_9BACI|nr:pantoate--beta-alanine ligase [Pontibacillus litoralis]KGX87941.1 pantoate--beta-alanine ligase [Pontibacillus litoralis JSM 072002]
MKIIKSLSEMHQLRKQYTSSQQSIGFVPTMGYLHEGHVQLMKQAKQENDLVVVSIFVNPLQFGPNEDFERYPRDEQRDIQCAKAAGVDVAFFPQVEEMYQEEHSVIMQVQRRVQVLCGAKREGHFDGVVTVLTKLFHLVAPTRVYFGMKDAQQVAVVDALLTDYHFPISLCAVPTVREEDGLAKSSRNVYLSQEERAEAPSIYQALQHGQQLIQSGNKHVKQIVEEVTRFIKGHTRGKIDYVDILSYPQLETIDTIDRKIIIAVAVQFQQARLIDNVVINEHGITMTDGR